MNIMSCESLYDTGITMQENTLITVNLGKPMERQMIEQYAKLGIDDDLLRILQTFNSFIKGVDTQRRVYTVEKDYFSESDSNCELSFDSLSTGERIFVICHIANTLKKGITVCRELSQLDMKHYRLFFKYWGHSSYIDVIIPNDQYEFIIREAHKKYS